MTLYALCFQSPLCDTSHVFPVSAVRCYQRVILKYFILQARSLRRLCSFICSNQNQVLTLLMFLIDDFSHHNPPLRDRSCWGIKKHLHFWSKAHLFKTRIFFGLCCQMWWKLPDISFLHATTRLSSVSCQQSVLHSFQRAGCFLSRTKCSTHLVEIAAQNVLVTC